MFPMPVANCMSAIKMSIKTRTPDSHTKYLIKKSGKELFMDRPELFVREKEILQKGLRDPPCQCIFSVQRSVKARS